ncbi:hypothetical protein P59_246 [Bacillus phage P59]|nr:hypothetical protein P59_017 [Bacillus phage P59]QIW88843.1 hypothetical protein P59_246 [Bacillus phage P59]
MDKKELERLAAELENWLDELDRVNDSPEIESIFRAVRDQLTELDDIVEGL